MSTAVLMDTLLLPITRCNGDDTCNVHNNAYSGERDHYHCQLAHTPLIHHHHDSVNWLLICETGDTRNAAKSSIPPFPLPPMASEEKSVAVTPLHPKPISLLPAIAKEVESADQNQKKGGRTRRRMMRRCRWRWK